MPDEIQALREELKKVMAERDEWKAKCIYFRNVLNEVAALARKFYGAEGEVIDETQSHAPMGTGSTPSSNGVP